jgi:hypothetical protein
MKALWQGEISSFMSGARRSASTFVMSFAKPWMRLMSLKSPIDSAPFFFGIRMTFALLRRLRSLFRKLKSESTATITSLQIRCQLVLKKCPVKPPGPGALSCGMQPVRLAGG